jgi:hypothetical protein
MCFLLGTRKSQKPGTVTRGWMTSYTPADRRRRPVEKRLCRRADDADTHWRLQAWSPAVTSLMTQLAALGLVTDSTT